MAAAYVFVFVLLAPLVDLGCHFGAHWILKEVPKPIVLLFVKRSKKIYEMNVQEKVLEKHDVLIDSCNQNGRPEIVKNNVSHYTGSKLGDLGGQEN